MNITMQQPRAVPTLLPSGAKGQNFSRMVTTTSQAPTSGRLFLSAVWIPAGEVITSVGFMSGTTALSGGTHGFAAVYDSSLVPLAQSTDDTSVAWAANAPKSFTLSAPLTVNAAGWYYLGVALTASTQPTLVCTVPSSAQALAAVSPGGTSTLSGVTTTAPNPAAAITASIIYYAYYS